MLEPHVLDHYTDLFEQFGEELSSELTWSVLQPAQGSLTIEQVLLRWGVGDRALESASLVDVAQQGDLIAFVEHPGSVSVLQVGGEELTRPGVLRRLTPGSKAFTGWHYWDGKVSLTAAVDGDIVAYWEYRLHERLPQAELLRPFAEAAAHVDEFRLQEAVFAGVEALSGIRLEPEHLLGRVPVLRGVPRVD